MAATLYLGFEGVLHPQHVTFREGQPPRMRTLDHVFFENNPLLEHVIGVRPLTCVILHSWWVYFVGYQAAVKQLPPAVQARVIGATSPGNRCLRRRPKTVGSRRQWLEHDLRRRRPTNPVLLDCDSTQITPMLTDRAVIVDGCSGLASAGSCEALIALLAGDDEGDRLQSIVPINGSSSTASCLGLQRGRQLQSRGYGHECL